MRKNKNSKQCSFIKPNGKLCGAWAMENSEFCFTHNPETKDLRKEAVIKGGKGNKKETHSLDLIRVENSKDVVDLIVKTENEYRRNQRNYAIPKTYNERNENNYSVD